MKRISATVISIFILLLGSHTLGGQNLSDLRISEIQAVNCNGLTDSYGERNGWIEIFNTSYGSVRFAGCFLTDDPSELRKYHTPSSDSRTVLGPRQSVVFHASGKESRGTFHTNFTIGNGSTVYLVSNDGKTIIDQLTVPQDLPADWSVVKVPCGVKMMDYKVTTTQDPTPGTYNGDVNAKSNSDIMKEKDPHGFVLTIISVMVVFLSLFILSRIFKYVGKASMRSGKKAPKPVKGKGMSPEAAAAVALALQQEYGGEAEAAIAMALHSYLSECAHDRESYILTIRPTSGSQWNDKTQTFRKTPRR
ncbi:MAG: lamin tail domain-containing protein [Bacteroidales bacterium]|nr:lamin tail domain-containing protein [Bacteroidales bacterium]